jgi:glycosyltransferase involved in cell wall biosynthesis
MSLAHPLPNLIKQCILLVLKVFFAIISRKAPRIDTQNEGLNLIGYYKADLGLGDALRYTAKALVATHVPFLVRQFDPKLLASQSNLAMQPYLQPHCDYGINCIIINPDMLYRLPTWLSFSEWTSRYNVAYWFWELPNFPNQWQYAIPMVDEIWVNTEFNAKAMRQAHQRVVKIPFAIEFAMPSTSYDRAYFDLPEQGFAFLVTFDFHSSITRKNPQAAIAAFLQAFADPKTPAYLIVKSINGHLHPGEFAQMQECAKGDPRIIFIDRHLTTEETRALMQCADCYVSLHRSEGLGLGMAESMYLGKPVIATAYSGNTEFMNEHNACLIDYQEIAVPHNDYPHAQNQVWAQADIAEAASAMQRMVRDEPWRTSLAKQARADMLEHHSFTKMGNAIAKRLSEIKALLA